MMSGMNGAGMMGMMGGGGGGRGPFGYIPGSYANIFQGLFGNPEKPYKDAQKQIERYFPQAQQYQQPFYNAGIGAIPGFQNWLQTMQNPSQFINNQMANYEESPYAKYQQQQGLRAAQNMGSASGLTGSTPLMQFAQQNAQDISSKDMNQWLQNVLGINSQYGQGMGNMMGMGQNAANSLTQLMSDYMNAQAQLAYGKGAAQQGQMGGLLSGITGLFGL